MTARQRFAAIFEAALPVAYQFADGLGIDVATFVSAGEAEPRMPGVYLQYLELIQGERG